MSGAGKSTLVREVIFRAIKAMLAHRPLPPVLSELLGWQAIQHVKEVDEAAIGRTPRSVPATYVGVMTPIWGLFAQTPEARTGAAGRAVSLSTWLDEPATGLHMAVVAGLIGVLQHLVEPGGTVVIIEHALDVMAAADCLIDLGPGGGRIMAWGSPEEVAAAEKSRTAAFLREYLEAHGKG